MCGMCFSVVLSGLSMVSAWFVLILNLSCTPWAYHGPMLIATGGLLFILWASFVPLGVESETRGILSYACERCGQSERCSQSAVKRGPGTVAYDVHPLSQLTMVMILSLLSVVIGFFISRDRLPSVTLSTLRIESSSNQTASTSPEEWWWVTGSFNIPWCEQGLDIHIEKTISAKPLFPFDVHDDGSFSGQLTPSSGTMVSGLTASCGGCFTTSPVAAFQWIAPGWQYLPEHIPFLDKTSVGTYLFPPLCITMLLGIMHAAICMLFNVSIFQCPCPCPARKHPPSYHI